MIGHTKQRAQIVGPERAVAHLLLKGNSVIALTRTRPRDCLALVRDDLRPVVSSAHEAVTSARKPNC